MYSRILVPIDGSDASNVGLREAIKLAGALHACLRLINVVDAAAVLSSEAGAASYDTFIDASRRLGADLLHASEAIVSHAGLDVDTALVEAHGASVGECVANKAREYHADLIVCGTHGRRGMRRLLMGSDAEYIVRNSPVPVVLVRARDGMREMVPVAAGATA